MHAMNEVNRQTEAAHFKTNVCHRIHKINTYGSLQFEDLRELLTKEEYKLCKNRKSPYPWHPMTTDIFIRLLHRQEVSSAAETAADNYEERTPEEGKTANGIQGAMSAAERAKIKSFRTEFEKLSTIAKPVNGKRWLEEINIYYSRHANDKIEMTVEKLQIIVGTLVQPAFKARWLSWWNSSNMNKKALHFPVPAPTKAKLRTWLVKACFWAERPFISMTRLKFFGLSWTTLLSPHWTGLTIMLSGTGVRYGIMLTQAFS